MKKTLISVSVVLVVLVLMFSLVACGLTTDTPSKYVKDGDNSQTDVTFGDNTSGGEVTPGDDTPGGGEVKPGDDDKPGDDTPGGGEVKPGDDDKPGDDTPGGGEVKPGDDDKPTTGKYVQPVPTTIPMDRLEEIALQVANKIMAPFDFDEVVFKDNEVFQEILTWYVKPTLEAAGVDIDTVEMYGQTVIGAYDAFLTDLFEDINTDRDVMGTLEKYMTEQNVRIVLAAVNKFSEIDASACIAATIKVVGELMLPPDAASLTADFEKGAEYYMLDAFVKNDETVKVVELVLNMLDKLSSYSAKELASLGKTVIKALPVIFENGPAGIMAQDSKVSVKDLITAVNTVGNLLNSMFDAADDAESVGLALNKLYYNMIGLFGFNIEVNENAELLQAIGDVLKHPEVVRLVSNLLATVDGNTVLEIYGNFDDWNKADEDEAEEKFGCFVASVIDFVKPEYQKLSAEAKQNIVKLALVILKGYQMSYDGDLLADADALVAMTTDLDEDDSEGYVAIAEGIYAIIRKFTPVDVPSYDYTLVNRNGYKDIIVVLADDATKEDVDLALGQIGLLWKNKDGNGIDSSHLTYQFAFEEKNGVRVLKLYGEGIKTKYLIAKKGTEDLVLGSTFYYGDLRFALNEKVEESTFLRSIDGYGRNVVYDKETGLYSKVDHNGYFRGSDNIEILGTIDTSTVGVHWLKYRILTIYGWETDYCRYYVYDPDNLQVESITGNWNYTVLTGDDLGDLIHSVSVRFDDGSRKDLSPDEYTVEGFDSSTEGYKILTIRYGNKVRTYRYFVIDPEKAELEYIGAYVKADVIYVGEDASKLDLVVTAYYNADGHSVSKRIPADQYVISGFDSSTEGYRKEATVSYAGKEKTFWYDVEREALHVYALNRRIYPGDSLSDLDLEVSYGRRVFEESEYTVEGFTSSEIGSHRLVVTLTSTGETAVCYYDCVNPMRVGFGRDNSNSVYQGEDPDDYNVYIKGEKITDYTVVTPPDFSEVGEHTFAITYDGAEYSCTYYVECPLEARIGTQVQLGDSFSEDSLEVFFKGSRLYEDYELDLSAFSTERTGWSTIRVNYKGYSIQVGCEVRYEYESIVSSLGYNAYWTIDEDAVQKGTETSRYEDDGKQYIIILAEKEGLLELSSYVSPQAVIGGLSVVTEYGRYTIEGDVITIVPYAIEFEDVEIGKVFLIIEDDSQVLTGTIGDDTITLDDMQFTLVK
ncbi:MAG: bacterial Ig-like domain-containing protein [Clostridia bacterium]|nr:bacterial Ig-like domain-containing protein [Clostridia bacterium]